MKRSEWNKVREGAIAEFERMMKQFGQKKGKVEDLKAGFSDGMSSAVALLLQGKAFKFEEEDDDKN